MRLRPLSPGVYLVRNASKTVPMIGVILLAVLLVAGIVAIMDSIPLSIRTTYGYSKHYLGVSPRGDNELTPRLKRIIEAEAPVPLGRTMVCRASDMEVKSIVGPWRFVIVGLQSHDVEPYIERLGGGRLEGRLPAPGLPEALVSEPLVRNLGLKMGDILVGPETPESYSPQPVRIVGIVRTDVWIALTSFEYHALNHMPPIDLLIVMSANPADQARLDKWAYGRLKDERARVFTFAELEKQTDAMFDILYAILNVVIALLVTVITVMMSLLMNIQLTNRMNEFGLLQAVGHTRRDLVRRTLGESLLLVVVSWVLGVMVAYGFLSLVRALLFDPRAFMLDPGSLRAYAYTLPVPVAIALTSALGIAARFRKFDPIVVIERRVA
jgi:hypothetical protein